MSFSEIIPCLWPDHCQGINGLITLTCIVQIHKSLQALGTENYAKNISHAVPILGEILKNPSSPII